METLPKLKERLKPLIDMATAMLSVNELLIRALELQGKPLLLLKPEVEALQRERSLFLVELQKFDADLAARGDSKEADDLQVMNARFTRICAEQNRLTDVQNGIAARIDALK
jgi:hypothetical protein